MKTRLALIVLLLVVLPTAVLSFLAGQVLRNWESILKRRLETSALVAVRDVSHRVQLKLDETLDEVRFLVADRLVRGGNVQDIARTAAGIEQSKRLVEQVYVFMSPVGFVYPERGGELTAGGQPVAGGGLERLAEAIRGGVTGEEGEQPRLFVAEDSIFCFAPLRNRKGLQVGFKVNAEAFNRHLETVLRSLSGDDFVLCARGAGLGGNEDVWVDDSFSAPADSSGSNPSVRTGVIVGRAGGRRLFEAAEPIHAGRLSRPLDYIEVSAYAENADKLRRTGAWQARLYGWGIVLVAGSVLAGAWLIVRQAGKEIQRARERSDFMMGVSHDLRTPISSMKVLAESLYMGHVADPEKQKRFLGLIVAECDRLADMIERVLFFVRQDRKAMAYTFGPVDMGTLVQSVLETFSERTGFPIRGKGVVGGGGGEGEIVREVTGPVPGVSGDWDALAKVLFNLLDNARKYSGPAAGLGRASRIEVRVTADEWRGKPGVRMVIADNGMGIPRSEWRRVFKRFYRGGGAIHKSVGGVGLGLSLCLDIVKAHRGKIEVESQTGEGSAFSVWLPAAKG